MPAARILVVDNESIIARGIENHLKRAGYTTLGIALSGVEAISLSCELLPDLILMDIVMDEAFDGIDATVRIHDYLDVPVIYVTAHDDEEHLQRAMQTEPYGYLIKPIEPNVLHSAVEVALHKHAAEKKLRQQLLRLTATRTIDKAILSQSELSSVLTVFLQQIVSSLSVDATRVMLFNPANQCFECFAALGFQELTQRQFLTHHQELCTGFATLQEKQVFIPDWALETTLTPPAWVKSEAFQSYLGIPLISDDHVKGVLEIFHRSVIAPGPEWLDTLDALAGQAQVALGHFDLIERLRRANREVIQSYDATIQGWSRALELRDQETQGHSQRVTEMTLKLAVAMQYPESGLVHIRRGALLHDIGKMGIPDGSLLKPGPLNAAEWEIMRQHPQYAYDLLKGISFLEEALEIPYCHHEKWNGTGYPRGLKGEEIPLAARIFSVVDVWDALRSERCYQEAWPAEKALDYIRKQAGTFFDPQVVEVFLKLFTPENF
jgi:response regulator RpfG family c-di-GMP phosphodiesterase